MSKLRKNLRRGFFIVIVILGVFLVIYLLYGKNNRNLKVDIPTKQSETKATANTSNTNTTEDFFQKPGAAQTNNIPAVISQTKSVAELERLAQNQASAPADYSTLAMAYYKNGNKDQALKTIDEGLIKYPDNNSLLLTKDLIENILPKL